MQIEVKIPAFITMAGDQQFSFGKSINKNNNNEKIY